jgi:hypothetical protein
MAELLQYPYYIYLHTNGTLITKTCHIVNADPNYFDSLYVVRYWYISSDKDLAEAKDAQADYKKKKGT